MCLNPQTMVILTIVEAETTHKAGSKRLASIPFQRRLVYLGILLALFAYSGRLYVVDEIMIYDTTLSLVEEGDVSLHYPVHMSVQTPSGDRVSPFPPGQSLLAVPFYLLAKSAAFAFDIGPKAFPVFSRAIVITLNLFFYAFGLVLTSRLSMHWGASRRQAFIIALTLGLGTFWWVYSQTLYRQLPAAVLTLYIIERLFVFKPTDSLWASFRIGAAFALLLLFRLDAVLLAPIILLASLWQSDAQCPQIPGFSRIYKHGVVLFAWGIAGGGALLLFNLFRSGSAFDFSTLGIGFSYPVRLSFPMYLFSKRLSLFLYSPPLLLVPFAWHALWRRNRRDAILILLFTLLYLYLYCRYDNWTGGDSWGPRFTLIQTPVWIALLGAWLSGGSRWKEFSIIGVTSIGIPIQLFGIVLDQARFPNFAELHAWPSESLRDTWWLEGWKEYPAATIGLFMLLVLCTVYVFISIKSGLVSPDSGEKHV